MCEFERFNVGERVYMHFVIPPMCDACASPMPVGTVLVTFIGHTTSRRYGLCDTFKYEEPQTCHACGSVFEYCHRPCDDGGGVLWTSSVEYYVEQDSDSRLEKGE